MVRDFSVELYDFIADTLITPKDVWQVALDGSGPLDKDGLHYAFAGVIAPRPAWGEFARRWEPVLNEFDLPYLRMVDAMNFRGPFAAKIAEWGEKRLEWRDDLLNRLVQIIRELGLRTIGFAVEIGVGGLAETKAALKKREVFQQVIEQVLADHRNRHFFLICDTEHDAADHYRSWLANLQQQRDHDAHRIACLCFADDKVFAPVQVADFAAYLLREEADRMVHRRGDPPNPLTVALRDGSPPVQEGRMINGVRVS